MSEIVYVNPSPSKETIPDCINGYPTGNIRSELLGVWGMKFYNISPTTILPPVFGRL